MRERLLTILAMASVVAVLGRVSLTVGDVHVPLTMGLGHLTVAHVAGAMLVVPAMARLATWASRSRSSPPVYRG